MSDFTSSFWSWYVILLTVGGIAYCVYLLVATGKMKVKAGPAAAAKGAVETTGHTWDGDLAEYNNPLPRWWMWLFWITIVFSVAYLVVYPGLGNFAGVFGWTSTGAYTKETGDAEKSLKPLYDKYVAMGLPAIAADPQGRAMGERIFLNKCAPCHGSDAAGSRGFPNLTDGDWLFGGEPEAIVTSITDGRMGIMPPLGPALGDDGVKNVVAYVRSLSGLAHDGPRAQQGRPQFEQMCAACHGAEGKGNPAVGAPNLTDRIWLHGSSEAVIAEGINKGRHVGMPEGQTPMPSFKQELGPARINLVAAYVWSLSNKAPAR